MMATSVLKDSTLRRWSRVGGALKGSFAGLFIAHGCGLFGGALEHPGVSQDSLDRQSVHWVVLQQPGHQIFGSVADVCVCRVGILHLDDKDNVMSRRVVQIRLKTVVSSSPLISCGRSPREFLPQKVVSQQGTRNRGPPDSTGPPFHRGFSPQSSLEAGSPVCHRAWTS